MTGSVNRQFLRTAPCGCSVWFENGDLHLAPCCDVHEGDLRRYVDQWFAAHGEPPPEHHTIYPNQN